MEPLELDVRFDAVHLLFEPRCMLAYGGGALALRRRSLGAIPYVP